MQNTYNVYADDIHSGKFQNEQTAFKFAGMQKHALTERLNT